MDLFTKGNHHKNLSVIFILQNLFHQGRGQCDISLNTNYIVFKNPRDRAQIRHLVCQVYPDDPKFLKEAYVLRRHLETSRVFVARSEIINPRRVIRFRMCIFPEDMIHYLRAA